MYMKIAVRCGCFGLIALASMARADITIQTVSVGNAGNATDATSMNAGSGHFGAVAYAYKIGKHEVTAGQYAAFLNAVATTDTFGLYNTDMAGDIAGCQIVRSGSSGSYTYSVASTYENRPVNYVSWGDAARFTNWLMNGQPAGAQDSTTTENGAYTLSGTSYSSIARNASATWAISSEDEWHKAAFYNPATTSYFAYATSSNTIPANTVTSPDPGNNANYLKRVSGVDAFTLDSPYYRTEAGDFENSASPYGTLDQNGNVWEWTESSFYSGLFRVLRGGSFASYETTLASSFRYLETPAGEFSTIGFRLSQLGRVGLTGDANSDGIVDTQDFNILAGHFSMMGQSAASGDFSGDGTVDSTDYNILLAHWGEQLSSSPEIGSVVPEPLTLPVLMPLLFATRRRRA